MGRRVFTFAAAVSTLLCLATIGLWVSTYFGSWLYAGVIWRATDAEYHPIYFSLSTQRGVITVVAGRYRVPLQGLNQAERQAVQTFRGSMEKLPRQSRWGTPYDFKATIPSLLGDQGFVIDWGTFIYRSVIRVYSVDLSVPFWFLTLLLALPPAAWGRARVRRALGAGTVKQHSSGTMPRPVAVAKSEAQLAARGRVFTVVSAISLLLCAATIVVLQLTDAVGRSALFTTAKGTLIELKAQHGRVSLATVSNWPQPEKLRFQRTGEDWRLLYPYRERMTRVVNTSLLGFTQLNGHIEMFLELDGSVMLLPYGRDGYHWASTSPLAYLQFQFSLREIALAAAILPCFWTILRVRSRIRRQIALNRGLCRACGYDLTANASGVCPECGTAVPAKPNLLRQPDRTS